MNFKLSSIDKYAIADIQLTFWHGYNDFKKLKFRFSASSETWIVHDTWLLRHKLWITITRTFNLGKYYEHYSCHFKYIVFKIWCRTRHYPGKYFFNCKKKILFLRFFYRKMSISNLTQYFQQYFNVHNYYILFFTD